MRHTYLARCLRRSPRRGVGGSISLGWMVMLTGLALATAAGVVLGGTGSSGDKGALAGGTLMLVLGALLAVLGVSSNSRLARLRAEVEALARYREAPAKPGERFPAAVAVPLLGQLLVHKYQLITDNDLARALARQKDTGMRLGRVLVEMNLITWPDLVRVLEDQVSYGDPWRRNQLPEQPMGQAPEMR